jgi:beta-glucosidase
MKKISLNSLLCLQLLFVPVISAHAQKQSLPQLGINPLQEVVNAMTLEEKIDLVVGEGMYLPGLPIPGSPENPSEAQKRVLGASGTTRAIPRLGIPSIIICDGPAGVHIFNFGKSRVYYGTAWPIGTLLASSWDTALVRKVGAAFGVEVKEYGMDLLNGPGMNIQRNPLGGRNFEYYSEDPIISGHIAAALINGFQSKGVGNVAKHFFANNQETNRTTINTIMSERAMREIYLKGWQIMVKQSNPWAIMTSYNRVNGIYTSENEELLNTILRKEWGYKGFVETDWYGGQDAVEQQKAGNNLLMPGTPDQKSVILDAVGKGELDEKVIDRNVEAILNIVVQSPVFSGYQYSDNPPLKENAEISRQAAAECMVLLKNEGETLPVKPGTSVALFGNNALELIAGGTGSGDVNRMYTVSLTDGMFRAGYSLNTDLYTAYSQYLATEKSKRPKLNPLMELMSPHIPIPEMNISENMIQKAADQSAIAIISIGRNAGEGNDRKVEDDYRLTGTELTLIKSVSTAFHAKNKKVVVVLNIGGVIDVMQWRDAVDGILLAWQPGLEGGNSIADIISGKVNPSGKLATTFPARYEDDASAKNFPGCEIPGTEKTTALGKTVDAEVIYEEGIYVGYRYYQTFGIQTAYPFGYGLSFTQFKFSDLKLNAPVMGASVLVNVTVTNTGSVAGKEVAELYISAPAIKLDKPSSELKAFAKTKILQPGESQELSFTLTPADLASFSTPASSWIAEAGIYTLKFGNAQETLVSGSFKLRKEVVVEKVNKVLVPRVQINELTSKSD